MRISLIIIVIVFVLSLASCDRFPESSLERRIGRVEHGLISSYGDPPWKRMSLEERMEYYNIPGVSITIINDFHVEWAGGYGVLEAGKSKPVTPETLFQAASVGKLVVAVAALHYVDRGLLELDDDVNISLNSWQVSENEYIAEEKVTLRRILSHSSGMTVSGFLGYALGEEVPNLHQILDGERPANSLPIRVDIVPGTQYRYSGGGYMIVQQLLEDAVGMPFSDIMQDIILEPWGMTASTFVSTIPENLWEIAASGHRNDGTVIPGRWHTYPEMGSGASMWATPSDLAQFAIRVMQSYAGKSGSVLSQDMAIQMLSPQIGDRGLGPVLGDDGDDLFYFLHPGGNEGFRCVLIAYPERGQGVVIMTNADSGEALWHEVLRSVSIEYGWVKDNSFLYVSVSVAIIFALLGALFLRKRRVKIK